MAQAVAAALGVTPSPRQPLTEAIVMWLGESRSLLVLDNCEHLLDAVAVFAERILSGCPGVSIVATSRERLGAPGERVVPVLPLPDSDGRELFDDRAGAAGSAADDPVVVGELCVRLDNLPLAIELAAARSASLGAAGLLAALQDPLRMLSGGRDADQRHRSLRAVLNWSYGLLDDVEQVLFRRLAVFAGGFDLGAAMVVSGGDSLAETADLLGRLVDKSLVTHQRDAGRWRLLGTVRAFARELLDADQGRAEVFDRYLDWASTAAGKLVERLGDEWRDDFDALADDLRAALLICPSASGTTCHRLARALGRLTYARRFLADSVSYYLQAAERAPGPADAALDLRSAADCAMIGMASGARVVDLLLASARRAEAAGDGNAMAITLARLVELVNRCDGRIASDISHERLGGLLDEARAVGDPGDPAVAAAIAVAAAWNVSSRRFDADPVLARTAAEVARNSGDPVLVSAGLDALGSAAAQTGRPAEAYRISQERLGLLPTLDRTDPRAAPEIDDIFQMAATSALRAGDLPSALDLARQMVQDDLFGNRSYYAVSTLVPALLLTGGIDEALGHANVLWDGWQRAGRPPVGYMVSVAASAVLGYGLRHHRENLLLWRRRLAEFPGGPSVDVSRLPSVVFAQCRTAVHLNQFADASRLVDRAFGDFHSYRYDTYACAAGAELAVVAGLPDAVERISVADRTTAGNAWSDACLTRARGRLHGDVDALAASLAGFRRIGARAEHAYTLLLLPGREPEGRAELESLGLPPPPASGKPPPVGGKPPPVGGR